MPVTWYAEIDGAFENALFEPEIQLIDGLEVTAGVINLTNELENSDKMVSLKEVLYRKELKQSLLVPWSGSWTHITPSLTIVR